MAKKNLLNIPLSRRSFLEKGLKGGAFLIATPSIMSNLFLMKGEAAVADIASATLPKEEIEKLLKIALAKGGDFSEVYIENRQSTGINMEEAKIKSVHYGISQGVGIRVIKGNKTGYAYSDDFTFSKLEEAAKVASYVAAGEIAGEKPINISKKKMPSYVTVKIPLETIVEDAKLELVKKADAAARSYDKRIIQAYIQYYDEIRERLIANSEGLWVENKLPLLWFVVQALSSHEGKSHMGRKRLSEHSGFELFQKYNVEDAAREAAREAIAMLVAKEAPAGEMPVVIGNGWGGVLVHEAVGHGMEADGVYRKSTIFADKIGQEVAAPLVTLIDDGTIPNFRGTTDFDDEGTPGHRTILVEKGVLKGYMQDLLSAKLLNMEPTGNGRRESFRYYPIPRMTNTFMDNGPHTPEEIIAATKKGIFVQSLSGGSVNPATGQFNFDVREAYMIEDGKKTYPVRDATLIGRGFEVIQNIDMVGNNLSFGVGICGKGQSAEVSAGQPTIRIARNVKVGGTKA
jgi:TldD protein